MANPDPEAGLTLTRSFPADSDINSALVERDDDCVYACELTWPSVFDPGCIFEIGGGGQGCWLGLNAGDGLVFTAGDGGVDGATPGNGKAVIVFDETAFMAAYGGEEGTLCWEIKGRTAPRLRLWWNNDLIGEAVPPNGAWESNRFSGGNTGGYGRGVSSLVRNMTGQAFETLDSALRYYDKQASAWQPGTSGPEIYVGAASLADRYVGNEAVGDRYTGAL